MTLSDDLLGLLGEPVTPQPSARSMASTPAASDDLPRSVGAAPATGLPDAIPAVLDEAGMSQLLGLSSPRVRALARDGLIVRCGRNRFDVRKSLLHYIGNLRDHAAQAGRPSIGGDELKTEKIRQARHAADKLEIQNAALRGEMLPAAEVERAWSGVLRDVRAALLAVPTRCGAALPHLTPHDVAAVGHEIKSALEGLADGN